MPLRTYAVTDIARAVAEAGNPQPKKWSELTQAERDMLVDQQIEADAQANREARAKSKAAMR